MLSKITAGVIGLMSLAAATTASAGTLYFSEDFNSSGLYTLNTSTGAATHVGTSGVNSNTVGLAPGSEAGNLYGSDPFFLTSVNEDGSGSAGLAEITIEGLAYNSDTDMLYGAVNGAFFSIDTISYSTTSLASPGLDVEGLAYGGGNIIYSVSSGSSSSLYSYDILADVWTLIGATLVNFNDTGLAYDSVLDILYAKGDQDSWLYSIDPLTGEATRIGDTGIAEGGGLAFVSDIIDTDVPEPAALGLLGMGLAGFGLMRRRRG